MRSSKVTTQIPQINMQQAKYRNFKFILTSMASLMAVTSLSMMPASAELKSYSQPTDPETGGYGGFPEWYEDSTGLKLELCLAPSIDRPTPPNYCLTEPPNPDAPASVSIEDPALSNFPDEAFWWTAEAQVQQPVVINGVRRNISAILVLATEAAFGNDEVIDGDQLAFNRTRIRIQGNALKNNTKYKVSYPYGVKVLTATQKDPRKPPAINVTEDFGCAPGAINGCDFGNLLVASANRGRLLNRIGAPWLKWDASSPAAPAGYIGDPNVDHKVIGSPIADSKHITGFQNYFKVEELAADGVTVVARIAYTELFSVSGKLSTR